MGRDEVLDLGRIDVLAARDDQVVLAVDDVDVAVLVPASHVAGVQPAAPERPFGGVGPVPVAAHDAVAADQDLADGAGLELVVLVVGDHDLVADARLAAGFQQTAATRRQRPAVLVAAQVGDEDGGLGLAVDALEIGVEDLERAGQPVDRNGRSAVLDAPQAGQVGLADPFRFEKEDEHRGHQAGIGDALLLDGAQHRVRVEVGMEEDGRANQELLHEVHVAAGVKLRQQVQRHIVGAGPVFHHRVGEPLQHLAVGHHGPLGQAGGAAGVHDGEQVVGDRAARRPGVAGLLEEAVVAFPDLGAVPDADPMAYAAAIVAQRLDRFRHVGAIDHCRAFDAVDDDADFARRQAVVQRYP